MIDIDPGAGLLISIFNFIWVIAFGTLRRKIEKLERIVEPLNEENRQKELIEKAKLREIVNKATEEKE